MRLQDIKLAVKKDLRYRLNLNDYVWEFWAEVHGENRFVGHFLDFRSEEGFLVFDFEPKSVYGEQFIRDYRAGNLSVSGFYEEEKQEGERIVGHLRLQVLGYFTMPEPPTTVCSEPSCEKIFPAMDAYISTVTQRPVCPECFEKGQSKGRMKLKEEQPAPTEG